MNKKHIYETPVSDLLVVRFERNILSGANTYHQGGAGHYDDTDTNDNGDY